MDKNDYWHAFESTGKISDYLSFKNVLSFGKEEKSFEPDTNNGIDNQGAEGRRG